MRARPTSVSVIGWLAVLAGALAVFFIGMGLVLSRHPPLAHLWDSLDRIALRTGHPIPVSVTMGYEGITVLATMACGIGLLRGQNAARWGYVVLLGVELGVALLTVSRWGPFLLGSFLRYAVPTALLFAPRARRFFAGDDSDPGDAYGSWTIAGFVAATFAFVMAGMSLPNLRLPFVMITAFVAALAGLGFLGAALAATRWKNPARDVAVVGAGVALFVGPALPKLIELSRHPGDWSLHAPPRLLPPEQRYAEASAQMAQAGASRRFRLLGPAAKAAFDTGRFDEAQRWALELKQAIPDHVGEEGFGDAVQDSNVVLGRLALREGVVDEAKERLLAAGRSSGSPEMDNYGPNVSLAADLLAKGETEVVLQYFDLCRAFWTMDRGKLDAWTAAVKQGEAPRFGANLIY